MQRMTTAWGWVEGKLRDCGQTTQDTDDFRRTIRDAVLEAVDETIRVALVHEGRWAKRVRDDIEKVIIIQ